MADAGPQARRLAAGLVAPPLGAAAAPVHGLGRRSPSSSASLFEIIPTFLIRSNVPTIASVQALHAAGAGRPRHLLVRGLLQLPLADDPADPAPRPSATASTARPGEFVYDHPFQWGSRRIGPDLHRVGGKHSQRVARAAPHRAEVGDARARSCRPTRGCSRRPTRLRGDPGTGPRDGDAGRALRRGRDRARRGARPRAGPGDPGRDHRSRTGRSPSTRRADQKKVIALVAYLQRLGTDIFAAPEAEPVVEPEEVVASRAVVKEEHAN